MTTEDSDLTCIVSAGDKGRLKAKSIVLERAEHRGHFDWVELGALDEIDPDAGSFMYQGIEFCRVQGVRFIGEGICKLDVELPWEKYEQWGRPSEIQVNYKCSPVNFRNG